MDQRLKELQKRLEKGRGKVRKREEKVRKVEFEMEIFLSFFLLFAGERKSEEK